MALKGNAWSLSTLKKTETVERDTFRKRREPQGGGIEKGGKGASKKKSSIGGHGELKLAEKAG